MENKELKTIRSFRAVEEETLKKMPLWMKCNYVLNKIYSTFERIGKEDESIISWEKINSILKNSNDKYQYNLFGFISSISELKDLRMDVLSAELLESGLPYYKSVCKTCKNEFTLSKRELLYFLNRDLKVPCRCYYCRKGIERPVPVVSLPQKEENEEAVKTEMQIAMEKARII